jgi:hypothetical protein
MSNNMDHWVEGRSRSEDQTPPPYMYRGRCFVRNPGFTPHWQNSQKVSIYKGMNEAYVWDRTDWKIASSGHSSG